MSKRRNVFHVDDSTAVRHVVRQALENSGSVVTSCANEVDALRVDAMGLDCAVLDMDLRPGNGVRVAHHLRTQNASLPIAFFTSSATNELRQEASKFGPIFQKPEELHRVVEWVQTIFVEFDQ